MLKIYKLRKELYSIEFILKEISKLIRDS